MREDRQTDSAPSGFGRVGQCGMDRRITLGAGRRIPWARRARCQKYISIRFLFHLCLLTKSEFVCDRQLQHPAGMRSPATAGWPADSSVFSQVLERGDLTTPPIVRPLSTLPCLMQLPWPDSFSWCSHLSAFVRPTEKAPPHKIRSVPLNPSDGWVVSSTASV